MNEQEETEEFLESLMSDPSWKDPYFIYKGKRYIKFSIRECFKLSKIPSEKLEEAFLKLAEKKGLDPYTPEKDAQEILKLMTRK